MTAPMARCGVPGCRVRHGLPLERRDLYPDFEPDRAIRDIVIVVVSGVALVLAWLAGSVVECLP